MEIKGLMEELGECDTYDEEYSSEVYNELSSDSAESRIEVYGDNIIFPGMMLVFDDEGTPEFKEVDDD